MTCTPHNKYPNLIHVRRSTQMSPVEIPLVQECSGLIVDLNTYQLVTMPFPKIFSTTSNRDSIPSPFLKAIKSCSFTERLDGKLACLYHYNGEWLVSSDLSADGSDYVGLLDTVKFTNWQDWAALNLNISSFHCSLVMGPNSITVSELFWQTWKARQYELPTGTSHCYIFEITSPRLNSTVEHAEDNITLIGVRDMKTLFEVGLAETNTYNWKVLETLTPPGLEYPIRFTQMDALAISQSPIRFAGYIAKLPSEKPGLFGEFVRLEIPSVAHRILEDLHPFDPISTSERYLQELVKCSLDDDWSLLDKYQYWRPVLAPIRKRYDAMVNFLQAKLDEVIAAELPKQEVAALLAKEDWNWVIFAMIKPPPNHQGPYAYNLIPNTNVRLFLARSSMKSVDAILQSWVKQNPQS